MAIYALALMGLAVIFLGATFIGSGFDCSLGSAAVVSLISISLGTCISFVVLALIVSQDRRSETDL